MLLTRKVKVRWNPINRKYYEEKGYSPYIYNSFFLVDVNDLQLGSGVKVEVACDYCLEKGEITIVSKEYATRNNQNKIIEKDSCFKCFPLKQKDVMFKKHGVENAMQIEDIKIKNTNLRKTNIDKIIKICNERNFTIINISDNKTDGQLDFICNKHPNLGIQSTKIRNIIEHYGGCKICSYDSRREENSYLWKGGISSLHNYLRCKINSWKIDSLKKYNYKCAISGQNEQLEIHHIYPFNKIINDTLIELNLVLKYQISDYSKEELKLIEEKCLELHYKNGLGIPLLPELHKSLHMLFGKSDTDITHINQLIENIRNGNIFKILLDKNDELNNYNFNVNNEIPLWLLFTMMARLLDKINKKQDK
ncbi:MAG TPA: hypothetical protein HA283_00595 [Nanoarchaeota archaeon]|nr:hypothetical protein [Nanoarchaeota archaeon]